MYAIHKKGFTLIEVLVVTSILGLIASVLLVALNDARSRGRDAKRVADLRQVYVATEQYYDKFNIYPQYPDLHSTDSTANWGLLITMLVSANFLAAEQLNYPEEIGVVPTAQAAGPNNYQDISYPNKKYGYMVRNGKYQFSLRAQLENTDSSTLKNSATGPFENAGVTTVSSSCDVTLGYYCLGTTSFNPLGSF
jgi:prepilin-type N-terminal cleavage/methylation domain-containing protein